ncbi:MAG: hypothetical protein HY741_03740 [Chloroflexi bacterium]|nr:hypothetical protein [Chloroflexota bacterium]
MSFFRKLFSGGNPLLPKASDASDPNAWWLYVQCNKCGAPLAIRIDLRNDISTDYETGGRFLRKEIMDSTCFQLMYAEARFDGNGNVVEQTIERGKFLTRQDYEAAAAAFQAKKNRE